MSNEGNKNTAEKLEEPENYDQTGSVRIPKMRIERELYSDTGTSSIFLISYKSKRKFDEG